MDCVIVNSKTIYTAMGVVVVWQLCGFETDSVKLYVRLGKGNGGDFYLTMFVRYTPNGIV